MKNTEYVSGSKLHKLLEHRSWISLENRAALTESNWFKLIGNLTDNRTEVYLLSGEFIGVFE